jgi:uncharacterized protein YfaT (DUF1175 family)
VRAPVLLALAALAPAASLRASAALERSAASLPADGTASATLRVTQRSLLGLPALPLPSKLELRLDEGASRVRARCTRETCAIFAGTEPGRVSGAVLLSDALGRTVELPFSLDLVADAADSDGDGFPDAVELTSEEDRTAFRRWFAAIAESQYYALDPRWGEANRDCAGLLRYAYAEALKKHDGAWRSRRAYLPDATTPDVRKYRYPNVPLLGERLFRVAPGVFRADQPVEQTFSASATARWLVAENAASLGKDRAAAGPGDLLFFSDPDAPGMGFHSMVYLGDLDGVPGQDDWVVYHTGPEGSHGGQVRKVRLSQLMQHPEEKWHPRADNPNFLGFYRWKIAQ